MLEMMLNCAVAGATPRLPEPRAAADELPDEFFEFIADWDEAAEDEDETDLDEAASDQLPPARDRAGSAVGSTPR